MGQGVQRLRRVCRDVVLDSFLERFFYFRIGRRIMIDNLVAMQDPKVQEETLYAYLCLLLGLGPASALSLSFAARLCFFSCLFCKACGRLLGPSFSSLSPVFLPWF